MRYTGDIFGGFIYDTDCVQDFPENIEVFFSMNFCFDRTFQRS